MTFTFETPRLLFRELTPSDEAGMFELDSNPEVHTYLGNNPVTDIEQIREVLRNVGERYKTNGTGRMAVILKESGEFIGWAGFKLEQNINGHEQFYDLGYRFIQKHWGKGYATEAAAAFVDYGFNVMKLDLINAYTESGNIASRKVLEKAGLKMIETFEQDGLEEIWFELKNPNLL